MARLGCLLVVINHLNSLKFVHQDAQIIVLRVEVRIRLIRERAREWG